MISNVSLCLPEIRQTDLTARRDLQFLAKNSELLSSEFGIILRSSVGGLFLELIPKQHEVYIKLNGYLILQFSHCI
jgi:hypothetical protein